MRGNKLDALRGACEVIATVLDGGILADGDGVERLPGLSEALETRPDDPIITRAWELVSEKREARRRADADWLDECGPRATHYRVVRAIEGKLDRDEVGSVSR